MSISGTIAAAFTLYFTGGNFYAAAAAYSIAAGIEAIVLAPTTRVNGPRLSDLANQISSYGATLPYLEGSFRIPGNVIWATDKQPTDHTTHQSSKGGGGTVSTTTTYSSSFAIAYVDIPFGEPACYGFARIWIDKKLAISLGPGADASTVIASAGIASAIRFYGGSQTQMPDPLIESYEGVGNTSAFRGTCYIVFENFELTPYGNRIPQIEVEIIRSGTAATTYSNICSLTPADAGVTTFRGRSWITDGLIYLWRQDASSTDYTHIDLFVSHDGQEKSPLGKFTIPVAANWEAFPVNTRDRFLIESPEEQFDPLTSAYTQRIVILDPLFQFIETESLEFDSGRWNISLPEFSSSYARFGSNDRMVAFDQDSHVAAFAIKGGGYYGERISVSSMGQAAAYEYLLSGALCCALACASGNVYALAAESDGKMHLVILNQADGTLISDFVGPVAGPSSTASDVLESIRTDGASVWAFSAGTVWRWNADGTFVILATSIGVKKDDGTITTPLGGQQCFIGDDHLIMQGEVGLGSTANVYRHQLVHWNATSSTTVPLSDIVNRLAARAPALTVDTSDLTSIMVSGSLVTKQMSRADYLNYLAAIYHFDGQPNGGTLVLKRRGGAPVTTIDIDDLAAHDFGAESPEPFPIDRAKELDVPQFISVNFTDVNNDYLAGNIPAQRLNTQSEQVLTLDATAVALDADDAAKLADIAKTTSLVERTKYTFATDYSYKFLQPADVILVDTHDDLVRARITQVTDQAGLPQFEAVADDAFIYDSAAIGVGGSSSASIKIKPASEIVLLDIPILRDQDDNAGFYARATPATLGDWPGASIVQTDTGSINVLGTVSQINPIGAAINALGAWAGIKSFDESNYLDVQLRVSTETLSSNTRDATLGGAGAVAIGYGANLEIICYRTATMLSAGVYRLTGLLRYLRGTEGAVHAIGDQVVFLGTAGTLRVLNDIGGQHEYAAVTLGRSIDSAVKKLFTNTGRGIEPFPPVQLGAGISSGGDILMKFRRQTRLSAPLTNGIDAPLGETAEQYLIEIAADSAGASIPRSYNGVTSSAFTYPNADRYVDETAGLPSPFYWRATQISSVYGPGQPSAWNKVTAAAATAPVTVGPGGANAFNPADYGPAGTFPFTMSNSNNTAKKTASGVSGAMRGTKQFAVGRIYFEFQADAAPATDTATVVGICTSSTTIGVDPITSPSGLGLFYRANGQIYTVSGGTATYQGAFTTWATAGSVIGVAVDLNAGKAWLLFNNTSQIGSPVGGTSPAWTFTPGTPLYAFFGALSGQNNQQATLLVNAANQHYAAPTGFVALGN